MGILPTSGFTIDATNGIFVDGSLDLRVVPDDANPLYTGTDVSFVFQFSQVAGSGVRTVFRADNQADDAYSEVRIDGSGNLIWDVNGTATTGIAITDLNASNRVACTYDTAGNIAVSVNGATSVTNTGATVPANVHTIWLGNDNGSDQLTGYIQDRIFAIGLEMTAAQLEAASDVNTTFICGTFPADMIAAGDFSADDFDSDDFDTG